MGGISMILVLLPDTPFYHKDMETMIRSLHEYSHDLDETKFTSFIEDLKKSGRFIYDTKEKHFYNASPLFAKIAEDIMKEKKT